ncbi:hypothetical protein Tco_0940664 [Tanacetum coccineum]|uniref:Uncharacterized protein n=1 Tax=Tanacetum coccineum TaxID=301880 RepID=A0ABQ5DUQ4_9ASTR
MKARATLLMALPNKDQLKFHSYQNAKLLIEAIEKRYGGNKESKKVMGLLYILDNLSDVVHMWLCLMAMLTIRARRFIKRTGKMLGHNNVKFPRNQENKGRENNSRNVQIESPTQNALIAQDGIGGYDWSYQAEESNYATMQ